MVMPKVYLTVPSSRVLLVHSMIIWPKKHKLLQALSEWNIFHQKDMLYVRRVPLEPTIMRLAAVSAKRAMQGGSNQR